MKNKNIFWVSLLGFSIFSYYKRSLKEVPVYYVDYLPFGFNALALPPFGVFINKEHKYNKQLLAHELVHWKQFKENGLLLFLLRFLWYQINYGYDKNPFEIEARFNESDFCKKNYTHCVRTGKAKTVYNPKFRE